MLLSHLNSRWIPEILVILLCSQISVTLRNLTETSQFSCLSFLAGCCTNKENNLPETQLPTRCQISLHSLGSSSSSPSVSPSKDTEKVKSDCKYYTVLSNSTWLFLIFYVLFGRIFRPVPVVVLCKTSVDFLNLVFESNSCLNTQVWGQIISLSHFEPYC